jgi:hypothetical protein
MLKTLSILIAATAIATPAFAETFVHEGTTYSYSVEERGAVKLITGEDITSHKPFTLTVKNGWVYGYVDGNPVSFSTRDVIRVKGQPTSTEVAAR